jgi:hypothetical protein
MTKIEPGTRVLATSATGEQLERRAITEPMNGEDFRVVWVCREDEWLGAQSDGREPEGIPWPAEAVRAADDAHVAV